MARLAWVCLGSALGGGARYLIGLGAVTLFGPWFPWGTLAVNVIGSFLIGAIMHVGLATNWISPLTRLFLTTGVMGGLTTYSAFNYETLALASDGRLGAAAGNLLATLLLCLAAGVLGLATGRALVTSFG
jgi:fluoride exporter